MHGSVSPNVDHMCLQYTDRAEFVPVSRTQGGTFAVFGVSKQDGPQGLLGYDAQGREIGRETAVIEPPDALLFVPSD
jgi:hypothetical protein